MSYATLLVHLQAGGTNTNLLQVGGDLAERFGARVIGIAACRPLQIVSGEGYVPGDLFQKDKDDIDRELKAAEAEFRGTLKSRAKSIEWRCTTTYGLIADFLAEQARCADLIIAGVIESDYMGASRAADTADLVMRAGRPVLIVSAALSMPKLDSIVVGWKDTREARRAALDALPLLKIARRVAVVEIVDEAEQAAARKRLDDVVLWLKGHGVTAVPLTPSPAGEGAAALNKVADDQDAGLIVAGAYGHSRLREWALGGVTRDLLASPGRCSLLSH